MSNSKVNAASLSSDSGPSKERNPQNFLLIWVDVNIDESKPDCQNTLAQLRAIVNNVNLCTTPDQCIQFLKDTRNEKAFLIVSGSLGQTLVPQIHSLPQLDAIYVFCGDKTRHEQWTKQHPKIKGVHTNIEVICKELPIAAKQCNQDSVVVSIVSAGNQASEANVNQLEPSFMYTQIFKEILLEMEHDDKSLTDFVAYCRTLHRNNQAQLKIIDEFKRDYRPQSAIWWYTRECFTYQMLNRALRLLEADTIIKMGFFIRDLHQEIQQLYDKQISNYPEKCFIVYRGQGLSIEDFKRLQQSKGGLLSFNNFLSTSKTQKEPLRFATNALSKTNTVGILFKMTIDTSVSSTPFASVEALAEYQGEKEILFSMHTVFRIGEMIRIDNTKLLYQVDLKLTADDDEQLRNLTKMISGEITGPTGWGRLGGLLLQISQFDKAEEVYLTLLEQPCSERHKSHYYNQLGYTKDNQGDCTKALEYYKKTLEIELRIHSADHPSLATTYNNIGQVYQCMKQYSKALLCYEKGLEIQLKNRSADGQQKLAVLCNNIGTVCDKMQEFDKALMFYEKVLKIKSEIYPDNHPTLITTYSNIAGTYSSKGEHSKAISIYDKSLDICAKSLPSNHHLLAICLVNIGHAYVAVKEYSKALAHFERALKVYQDSSSAESDTIKIVQNNIKVLREKLKSKN